HREIKRIQLSATKGKTNSDKQREPERDAAEKLDDRSQENRASGADDAFEIDFESDHEKQEDQTQFRNGFDLRALTDPAGSPRAQKDARCEIRNHQRESDGARDERKQPRRHDAQRNVLNEVMGFHGGLSARALRTRGRTMQGIEHLRQFGFAIIASARRPAGG